LFERRQVYPQPAPAVAPAQSNQPESEFPLMGLLIHCACDGLAMGASAVSGSASSSMGIFLAIIMHKAPGAFGLASVLMGRESPAEGNFSSRPFAFINTCPFVVKRKLRLFCAMAPLSSLAFFIFFRGIGVADRYVSTLNIFREQHLMCKLMTPNSLACSFCFLVRFLERCRTEYKIIFHSGHLYVYNLLPHFTGAGSTQ